MGAALRQLVNRFQRLHPCRVKLQLAKMGALPQQTRGRLLIALYRNALTTSASTRAALLVNISLASADGILKLIVEDNGVGFNVEEAWPKRESFGLSGMRERVALLGGKFQVESRAEGPKRGTKISIELPIAK